METIRRISDPLGSYKETSDSHQNSTEVGQTAKGDWYVKSVKVYETNPEPMDTVLRRMMKVAIDNCEARNTELEGKTKGK